VKQQGLRKEYNAETPGRRDAEECSRGGPVSPRAKRRVSAFREGERPREPCGKYVQKKSAESKRNKE